MGSVKERNTWQYGDFQTPPKLAHEICRLLVQRGISPKAIIEPTCGRGTFLVEAAAAFLQANTLLGAEINSDYVVEARERLGTSAKVEHCDFFATDWDIVLSASPGPWLVLGNPPWVTNAELGLLKSTNLPAKTNFQKYQGLDAITGKANFDISEWMLLAQLDWLKTRSGWVAVLVKTSVARKVLRQAWGKGEPVGRAAIYKIDAMESFGASVDACLFILPVGIGEASQDCDVYDGLSSETPTSTIGFHDKVLVSNVPAYLKRRDLAEINRDYIWRSGIKQDCSKVMEIIRVNGGLFRNGLDEHVELEPTFLFPFLKSSDVANGRTRLDRFMIVTQREIGQDTTQIALMAPRTWHYLVDHAERLDARGSVIYKGKPRFSVFGVGSYTFAPWKVAISGFYKAINFTKVGPSGGKPVVLDDAIYFLSLQTEEAADFILSLVQSRPYMELIESMIFNDEKRPVTADILRRVSLERVAEALGWSHQYDSILR